VSQVSHVPESGEKDAKDITELQQLKVASINLFNFIEPPSAFYDFENIYSHQDWHKKMDWFKDFLTTQNPDVIGFQEVFSPDALKALTQDLGYAHFAVLDAPELVSDYVFRSPVVALASRFPIVEMALVKPEPKLCQHIGVVADFAFSRQPLRVTLALPQLGLCDFYVVHLKSKRSDLGQEGALATGLESGADLMVRQALGRVSSNLQRATEAALLFHQIMLRRQKTEQPLVLMGDFNDSLSSSALEAFKVNPKQVYRADIDDKKLKSLFEAQLTQALNHFCLFDSYELYRQSARVNLNLMLDEFESGLHDEDSLPPCPSEWQRASTHYFGNTGSVLDYILVSSEFDASQNASLAEVSHYQTFDRHLVRPDYERDKMSTDHAPVMMTLTLRR
jgi:endonuclease/exonuclease/phosphatase family metal-dependent hydrolase